MGASLISFFGAIINEKSQWLGGFVITLIYLYNQFFPRIFGGIGRSSIEFIGKVYLFFTNQSKKKETTWDEEVKQLIN
jgi:hypothetical protein